MSIHGTPFVTFCAATSVCHCRRGKKDKWVKEYQGQLLISTGAVQWTTDCSKALNAISGGNKTALKALKKKQVLRRIFALLFAVVGSRRDWPSAGYKERTVGTSLSSTSNTQLFSLCVISNDSKLRGCRHSLQYAFASAPIFVCSGRISQQNVGHGSRAADQDRAQQAGGSHHYGNPQPVRRVKLVFFIILPPPWSMLLPLEDAWPVV